MAAGSAYTKPRLLQIACCRPAGCSPLLSRCSRRSSRRSLHSRGLCGRKCRCSGQGCPQLPLRRTLPSWEQRWRQRRKPWVLPLPSPPGTGALPCRLPAGHTRTTRKCRSHSSRWLPRRIRSGRGLPGRVHLLRSKTPAPHGGRLSDSKLPIRSWDCETSGPESGTPGQGAGCRCRHW